jgi:putative dimethyl sulfoxide reductase chaperone
VDSMPGSPALLMISPAARAVARTYREAGLAMIRELTEPPDHIATELEFMYFLCSKETESWLKADNAEAHKWRSLQAAFTAEHLTVWGADFCQRVQDETTESFYAVLAYLAQGFFRLESEARP